MKTLALSLVISNDQSYSGYPKSIAVDSSNHLFIADTSNHRIHQVKLTTRIISFCCGKVIVAPFPACEQGGLKARTYVITRSDRHA
jgi:hypothetical protein